MEAQNTRLLLALLFTGTLMGALDLAIIGPALPVIGAEFDMQQRELSGLINSYTLLQMIGSLLLAKLSDRHGPRPVYMASILLFAAGSLVLVVADAAWMLYFGRALQGFGAGGFFPASAAVIGARLAPAERGKALGILGMVWGVAFIAGPILGGIFLRFSWQWLFAINLPIAAILIVGSLKLLPANGRREPLPFDVLGLMTLITALGVLIAAITSIDAAGSLPNLLTMETAGLLAVISLLVTLFWRIEKRAPDPIVRPSLFDSAQITKSCFVSTTVSAVQSGSIFLPALLVLALDISAANSALLLLPGVIAATAAAPVFGRMINRVGTRFIIVLSQILVLGGLLVYAFANLSITTFLFASIISGIGSAGLVGAPLRFIVLAETGNHDRASAQGLLSVASSVGRLLGASLVGAVAASHGGGVRGYQAAFTALVVVAVMNLMISMTLKSRAAEQLAMN